MRRMSKSNLAECTPSQDLLSLCIFLIALLIGSALVLLLAQETYSGWWSHFFSNVVLHGEKIEIFFSSIWMQTHMYYKNTYFTQIPPPTPCPGKKKNQLSCAYTGLEEFLHPSKDLILHIIGELISFSGKETMQNTP